MYDVTTGDRVFEVGDELDVVLAADINERAGEVESIRDAKRDMLVGMRHELRMPLARMKRGVELLEGGEDAFKARKCRYAY